MAYYPVLMTPFHQVINAIGKGSTTPLKNNLSHYSAMIESHFLLWLKSADVPLDLLMDSLTDYITEYQLANAPIGLGEHGLAQQLSYVFAHYVNSRIEPDNALGLCLLETYLNGCEYVTTLADSYTRLIAGDRLCIVHEKSNPFDDNALLVTTMLGEKLGYIPRKHNTIPAFLSKQDKTLFAILKRKAWDTSGHQLKVLLYVETP